MSFVVGIITCAAFLAVFILGGGNPALLLDWHSALLVVGGMTALGCMGLPGGMLRGRLADAAYAMRRTQDGKLEDDLLSLARLAREKGLLALENAEVRVSNMLVREGLLLISGGAGSETVRAVLERHMEILKAREKAAVEWFEHAAYLAIGIGGVGTLLKAVMMLHRYTGPQALAAGIAGALLPVAYGALAAYLVLLPLAARIQAGSGRQENARRAAIEGILAIQAGEPMFVVQERLHTILHPAAGQTRRARGG